MKNIDYFKKFISVKEDELSRSFDVWSYTRISSKDQSDFSLITQKKTNKEYAIANMLKVIEEFGGTYESAKSDFTRKEFNRLIEKIKSSRKKPYAVLVYKMSRFSRSGGNAIGLVNYLVEELGVHLIETSSGLNTCTERGKAAIYESLFHAYKENLERKEIILPNMIAFLKKGFIFGICPMGYDHYGPRVRREGFLRTRQKIVINKTGEILKEAWQWKLSGNYSDSQIITKLNIRGVPIIFQKLHKIWRNPFYCGISLNKLNDEPTIGHWEPLVSMEDFIKVQELLDNKPVALQRDSNEDNRPLNRLIKCADCGRFLVGYEVTTKKLHYYKCPGCKKVSVNAKTTPHSLKKGANELFVDFLEQFTIDEELLPLIKLQLQKLFYGLNDYNKGNEATLKEQLKNKEENFKQLKIRLGLGKIDDETYQLTSAFLLEEIAKINKELNALPIQLSNLDTMIESSLKKAQNISKIWTSSDIDEKRNLHRMLFPDAVLYDGKKHRYLTTTMNLFFKTITSFSMNNAGNKKRNYHFLDDNSLSVARSGVEPETFGL